MTDFPLIGIPEKGVLETLRWGAPECNKQPILQVLKQYLDNAQHKHQYALEIGSGTGQHAVYFAQNLPVAL